MHHFRLQRTDGSPADPPTYPGVDALRRRPTRSPLRTAQGHARSLGSATGVRRPAVTTCATEPGCGPGTSEDRSLRGFGDAACRHSDRLRSTPADVHDRRAGSSAPMPVCREAVVPPGTSSPAVLRLSLQRKCKQHVRTTKADEDGRIDYDSVRRRYRERLRNRRQTLGARDSCAEAAKRHGHPVLHVGASPWRPSFG